MGRLLSSSTNSAIEQAYSKLLVNFKVVIPDISMLADFCEGLDGGHVLLEHEVGEDERGGPRHAHEAVDEHLAAAGQRRADELGHLLEVHGDVGLRHVQQAQALVLDAERLVEVLARVHRPEGRALRAVHHVRDAQSLQVERVLRRASETARVIVRLNTCL